MYSYMLDGQSLVGRIHGWTLVNCPRLEDAGILETEVPMEAGGVMFVDDEVGHLGQGKKETG